MELAKLREAKRTGKGPKVNVKERVQDFYAKTPALHELGWICKDGELRMPFSFDAAKMAEEYPDLRKPLLIFEKTFDKLLKADEHIDKLILSMVPAGVGATASAPAANGTDAQK